MSWNRPQGHQLSNAEAALLAQVEAGEHTFRSSNAARNGETIEALVNRLADSRIMQNQAGRYLGASPCI